MAPHVPGYSFQKAVNGPGGLDAVTAYFPRNDDPRFMHLSDQMQHCHFRFSMFCRCARELGEDDTRCKYQFFRAQNTCHENKLETWMELRAKGACNHDILPDREARHLNRWP